MHINLSPLIAKHVILWCTSSYLHFECSIHWLIRHVGFPINSKIIWCECNLFPPPARSSCGRFISPPQTAGPIANWKSILCFLKDTHWFFCLNVIYILSYWNTVKVMQCLPLLCAYWWPVMCASWLSILGILRQGLSPMTDSEIKYD